VSSGNVQRGAQWVNFLNDEEKQRLDLLNERILRKTEILQYSFDERKQLMGRAIRRMRRAGGKK
jgi:hypothetical protein